MKNLWFGKLTILSKVEGKSSFSLRFPPLLTRYKKLGQESFHKNTAKLGQFKEKLLTPFPFLVSYFAGILMARKSYYAVQNIFKKFKPVPVL